MAINIRRYQISSDTFAIKNGWLQLDGPSIRIDSIASLSVVRNIDDINYEHEAKIKFKRDQHIKRMPLIKNFEIFFIILFVVSCGAYINSSWSSIKYYFITNFYEYVLLLLPLLLFGSISFILIIVFLLYVMSLPLTIFTWVASKISYLVYEPILDYSHVNVYELVIDTSSSMEFFFLSSELNYLYRTKSAIEEAIASQDLSISYYFNISAQTIEKIQTNMNQVTNSPGAAIIGDNASNVNQTTNVSIKGIQDIAQLSALVEQSNAPNKALMQECLDIVRNHLAGTSSKAQAKNAWETFIANVGTLAKVSNDIWSLIARVAGLVG